MELGFMARLAFCYLFAFSLQSVNALETLNPTSVISVNEIPGLLSKGKDALPYNRVLENLRNKVDIDINYQFYPASRSSFVFRSKQAICMFPASLTTNVIGEDPLIETIPINNAQAFFLGNSVINAKDILRKDAEKKVIGFRRGNSFGGTIEQLSHHTLVPLDSDEQSAKLLHRGRINLILAYMPDSLAILNMYPERPLIYSQDSLFYDQPDSFLCHKTTEGIAIVSAFNREINAMKRLGELKRLLGDAYIE